MEFVGPLRAIEIDYPRGTEHALRHGLRRAFQGVGLRRLVIENAAEDG